MAPASRILYTFLKAELCDQQLPHSVETEFDLAMVYSTMPTP